MGGAQGIDYAELLSPETSDPSQDQCSHVRRNGRLLFLVLGMVVIAEVLIQGQQSIHCVNVNSHSNANTKAAEEIDQDQFMQRMRHEKLNRWINTGWVMGCRQRNAVRRVHGSEMCVIWQLGCFTGQTWLETLPGAGQYRNSENRSSLDNQLWLGGRGALN
uniref:Uncharacterized protein n=1 Tax=Romanomermis culicivorax TaxID=13658 RepID=A0A915KY71_ROMCU